MKKKILLTFGILCLFLPIGAKAATDSVTMSCSNTKLSPLGSTTCTIVANITSKEISTVHAEILVGSNLSLISVTPDSSWLGDGEDGVLDLYTDTNKTGTFPIATFQIKAGSITTGADTSISLNSVILSDASFHEIPFTTAPVSIRIQSNINTLSNITIDGTGVTNFSPSVTTYNMKVASNKKSVNIVATKTSSLSTVTGDIGTKTLNYGINTFHIQVTSENGSVQTYTLQIERPECRELQSLTVNGTAINLESGKTQYDMTVENDVTEVNIHAELKDGTLANFVDSYGPRSIEDLKVGNNQILIKIEDVNGEQYTYTLMINRLDESGEEIKDPEDPSSGEVEDPEDPSSGEIDDSDEPNSSDVIDSKNPSTGDMPIYMIGIVGLFLLFIGVISAKKLMDFRNKRHQ